MRRFLVGFAIGICMVLSLGTVWDATYEGVPQGNELASDLDLFIQDFKEEIANRIQVESIFGIGTDDNGLARMGSARAFLQDGAPTEISGLGQYNSTAEAFVGKTLLTDEIGATTRDIGAGRMWVDLDGPDNLDGTPDDNTVWVYSETRNEWVLPGSVDPLLRDVVTGASFFFDPGKYNLIYNGSFEITDGTGAVAATAVPIGWTGSGTPDYAYNASPTAQGDGLVLEITATGAVNEGIQRTLGGLKASTTYYVTARAAPQVAADSCSLRTTGGATNLPGNGINTVAAGTAWTTISGYFITDGVPTDVVLILEADAAGDICEFDHVAVYETSADRRGLTQPGIQVMYDDNVGAATTTVPAAGTWQAVTGIGDFAVTPPSPGYIIKVNVTGTWGSVAGTSVSCDARIFETSGASTLRTTSAEFNVDTPAQSFAMHYINSNPTTGVTLTYSLDVQDADAAGGGRCELDVTDGDTAFTVELIPTR